MDYRKMNGKQTYKDGAWQWVDDPVATPDPVTQAEDIIKHSFRYCPDGQRIPPGGKGKICKACFSIWRTSPEAQQCYDKCVDKKRANGQWDDENYKDDGGAELWMQ